MKGEFQNRDTISGSMFWEVVFIIRLSGVDRTEMLVGRNSLSVYTQDSSFKKLFTPGILFD